ncbi:MAG: hypothetical protein LBI45_08160 [Bacteroidales bacterium]|jgi:hypothetical protein|nr:hypothetical protein [Bacteroidales bacterium]
MKKLLFILFFCALFIENYAQDNKGYWEISGNSGNDKSNFLGTTDCMPLIFKTNNTDRMKLLSDKSFLGIGLTDPKATLHLHYQLDQRPCETPISLSNIRKLLQLTTDETGETDNSGFGVYYSNTKDIIFKQQEEGMLSIEGPGGGISIAPENGFIGIGTDQPQAPLHINYHVELSRKPNPPSPGLLTSPILKFGALAANAGFSIYGFPNSGAINIQQNEQANLKIGGYSSSLTFIHDGNINMSIPSQAKFEVNGLFSTQNANVSELLSATMLSAQSANVFGATTTNLLNAQSASVVGTTTTNQLSAQSANVAGTTTTNQLSAQSANIAGTITANTLNVQKANFTGTVDVNTGIQTLSLGSSYHSDLSWGTSYIGFNAKRNNGNWTLAGDGANNGGAVIWSTVDGSLLFASIPKTSGSTQTISDAKVKENIKLYLTPNGVLKAKEVLVSTTGWPDYVFAKDYKLLPLSEVEEFIDKNQHLPNVPSAVEVENNGIQLGEMNAILIRKVEELTLYVLDLQKQITNLQK